MSGATGRASPSCPCRSCGARPLGVRTGSALDPASVSRSACSAWPASSPWRSALRGSPKGGLSGDARELWEQMWLCMPRTFSTPSRSPSWAGIPEGCVGGSRGFRADDPRDGCTNPRCLALANGLQTRGVDLVVLDQSIDTSTASAAFRRLCTPGDDQPRCLSATPAQGVVGGTRSAPSKTRPEINMRWPPLPPAERRPRTVSTDPHR